MTMEIRYSKMGCSESSSMREVHSDTRLPQETRKISNEQANFTLKGTGKNKKKQSLKLEQRK